MAAPFTVAPFPYHQFFDNDGNPAAGYFLYTYASGTTTPATTYSTSSGTAHTNPIELDQNGRVPLFLQAISYRFDLVTDLLVPVWSIDGVASTGLSQSAVGIGGIGWAFGGSEYTPITNTSYSAGTAYTACHADTSFYSINSSLLTGDFALTAMMYALNGSTVTAALVNLSDGSPDTPIAEISSASSTGALVTSATISFASPGTAKTYAIKVKNSASTTDSAGFVFAINLTRTA